MRFLNLSCLTLLLFLPALVLAQGTVKLQESAGNGPNFTALKAAASISNDVTYTLPPADGSTGQVLSTNGSGTLSWAVDGGAWSYSTKSANYSVLTTDANKYFFVSGTSTITLPAPGTVGSGFMVGVSNSGSNTVTVSPNAAETIGGSASLSLAAGNSATLVTDGTNWFFFNQRSVSSSGPCTIGDPIGSGYCAGFASGKNLVVLPKGCIPGAANTLSCGGTDWYNSFVCGTVDPGTQGYPGDGDAMQTAALANLSSGEEDPYCSYHGYCDSISIDGVKWRPPSMAELASMYPIKASLPSGAAFASSPYWTGISIDAGNAFHISFSTGTMAYGNAGYSSNYGRCVRLQDYTVEFDVTPNTFSFTDETNVSVSTLTNSNILQITGMNAGTAVSVDSGEFRTCSDSSCSSVIRTWGSASTTIDGGQYLQLRLTSASLASTVMSMNVTVGTVSDNWSVATTNSGGVTMLASFSGASESTTGVVTVPSASNLAAIVFVGVNGASNVAVTGVTLGGASMTSIGAAVYNGGSSDEKLYAFYLVAPSTGSLDLVITTTNGGGTMFTGAIFSGVNQTTPVSTRSTDTTSPLSVTPTGVATGYPLIGATYWRNSGTAAFTSGGGQARIKSVVYPSASNYGMAMDSEAPVDGAQSLTYTLGGSVYAAEAIGVVVLP
jgi:hypothetical protein